MGIKYRKKEVRNTFNHSHFLTFSTYHRKPYLRDERICKLLAKRLNLAAQTHNFVVFAYVFMPDHVHLLVHPMNEEYDMAIIRKAIKQGPSKSAKNRKWITTDLWEAGGGHDSNISHPKARREAIAYIHNNPVRKELVDHSTNYRWSSAAWFFSGDQGDVECKYTGELWD